jgi:hypothetical protein
MTDPALPPPDSSLLWHHHRAQVPLHDGTTLVRPSRMSSNCGLYTMSMEAFKSLYHPQLLLILQEFPWVRRRRRAATARGDGGEKEW